MVTFIITFWLFYQSRCNDITCTIEIDSFQVGLTLFKIFFPIWAALNSARLAVVYRLSDEDDKPETFFYWGLFSLFGCYAALNVFFVQFFSQLSSTVAKMSLDSPILIAEILLISGTLALLLADTQNWDKSSFFVKARVSISLLHIVLFLISPPFGVLTWMIIVPVFALLSDNITS